MRRGILALTIAAAATAACDDKPTTQDQRTADQALARDNLETNDLTAIDAASGADSNMAADIDIANMALNEGEGEADEPADRQSPRNPRPKPAERPSTDDTPPANTTEPPETEDGAN